MARCAELKPGETVLDPMCGKARKVCVETRAEVKEMQKI